MPNKEPKGGVVKNPTLARLGAMDCTYSALCLALADPRKAKPVKINIRRDLARFGTQGSGSAGRGKDT